MSSDRSVDQENKQKKGKLGFQPNLSYNRGLMVVLIEEKKKCL